MDNFWINRSIWLVREAISTTYSSDFFLISSCSFIASLHFISSDKKSLSKSYSFWTRSIALSFCEKSVDDCSTYSMAREACLIEFIISFTSWSTIVIDVTGPRMSCTTMPLKILKLLSLFLRSYIFLLSTRCIIL